MFNGIFGGMFDLDRNGEMDAFERALEYQFIHEELLAKDEESDDENED